MKVGRLLISALLILFSLALTGFVYEDPTGLYTTVIPDHWIYQAHYSTDSLIVFYGAGELELLYFQQLSHVLDEGVDFFARRSLETYAAAGGLTEFQIKEPFTFIDIDGKEGVCSGYSYLGNGKERLFEYRIFVLLPKDRALSITFSNSEDCIEESLAVMEEILKNWRWSF